MNDLFNFCDELHDFESPEIYQIPPDYDMSQKHPTTLVYYHHLKLLISGRHPTLQINMVE